jgi:ankyrin repeat protein
MKALLDAGAKPDFNTPYGSPLTFAAISGNVPGAQMLFERGADVNMARGDGNTPLMMAAFSGSPQFVSALIEHKADVNAKNYTDATALMYAARAGNTEAGKVLIDAGAALNEADANGETALMAAAKNGYTDFVKMLIARGSEVNLRDAKGRTALILAASYGDSPQIVSALLAAGATKDAKDARGRTAAAFASARGFKKSSALLGRPSTEAMKAMKQPQSSRVAVASSLKLLQSSMKEFSRGASCVSCHQEGLGRMATASAKKHGFPIDRFLQKEQVGKIGGMLAAMKPMHEAALKSPEAMKKIPLIEMNEVTPLDSWLLTGMAAQNEPASAGAAAMAQVLARQQSPDGSWTFSLPRIPMQSSFFTFTALSARALSVYSPASAKKETADRIARAKAWLVKAPAKTCDDRAFRLLGLNWSGATAAEKRKAVQDILAAQLPDGGWAQTPGMRSDAYATGQAIYALRVGGSVPASSPAVKKAVQYLLRTQESDGSWFVNKRAFPANNYSDGGFPHGESQYASFNATCWAMMGLLETLPAK